MSCQKNELLLEQRIEAIEEHILSTEVEKFFGCPFCGRKLCESWNACCGEAGHGETLYEHEDVGYYMNSLELDLELRSLAIERLKQSGESGVVELLNIYARGQK